MKYTYRSSLQIAMLLFATLCIAVLINACTKPTQGIKVIVDSSTLFPAPTVIKFTNADSTSANVLGNFTVTISGPGANYVQMASGGTNFQATKGLLSLALTKSANPSPTNPIVFTVSATLPNFAPILQNIVITQNALSIYNVKALEYGRPAAGTTVLAQVNTALTSGATPGTYTLTTPKTASMTQQATVTFAGGTQMQDANGTAITAGTLNLNIVQYGTGNSASLQALPGGKTTSNAIQANGTPIGGNVNFVTAGLLQINLSAGGVPVKSFSKPVSVSIELNSNQTNFATRQPIKAGDIIPYWSLNETTGQWKSEGNTTVVLDANNQLSAPLQISHLSCWSVGWTWGATGAYSACGSSLNVTINTSDATFQGGPYNVSLETPDGTYLTGVQGITIANGNVVNLPSLPGVPQAKIVISGGIPFTSVESSLFEPCSAGSVAVTVPVSSNTVNIGVNIIGLCNGKDVTVLPSATFELYQQTGSTYTDAGTLQLVNGKGGTGLQVGKMYYLTTTYNGTNYTTDAFSVTKTDFTVPSPALTLTAKFDAASNTLNFSGSIPINCN
jgi:hypothetical protein